MVSLVLDGLIIVLLVATVTYCVLLNRRLAALRKDKGELEKLLKNFAQATARAEAGIGGLRGATDSVRDSLKSQVDDAKALYDELSFIIERGDALANRLGGRVSASLVGEEDNFEVSEIQSRPAQETSPVTRSRAQESPVSAIDEAEKTPSKGRGALDSLQSRAERELFKALNLTK